MGAFSRSNDNISANFGSKKPKAAAKMISGYLLDATEDFEESKKEIEALEAEESRYKRVLDEANAGIKKYEELAKRAVRAGNDSDARVFIKQKQFIESHIEVARKAYKAARENAEKMRQMHSKIAADIEALKELQAQMGVSPGAETQAEAGNGGVIAYATMLTAVYVLLPAIPLFINLISRIRRGQSPVYLYSLLIGTILFMGFITFIVFRSLLRHHKREAEKAAKP